MLAGIGVVQEIGYHSVKDSITQEFETLVVGPTAVFQFHGFGAMNHGQLIGSDVSGIIAGDAVNKNIKLLFLDEKELYK